MTPGGWLRRGCRAPYYSSDVCGPRHTWLGWPRSLLRLAGPICRRQTPVNGQHRGRTQARPLWQRQPEWPRAVCATTWLFLENPTRLSGCSREQCRSRRRRQQMCAHLAPVSRNRLHRLIPPFFAIILAFKSVVGSTLRPTQRSYIPTVTFRPHVRTRESRGVFVLINGKPRGPSSSY